MFYKDITSVWKHLLLLLACMAVSTGLHAYSDIELESLDGDRQQLSRYIGQGKWTVVNIWGPSCPPCLEEIPELVLFHDDHHDRDATVLGIAIDFPSFRYAKKNQVREFVEDNLVSFPILLSDASITERMGAGVLQGLPSTYMYTPQGKLVGYQVGGITLDIIEDFIRRYESKNRNSKKTSHTEVKSKKIE